MKKIALALSLAGSLFAADTEYNYEITPTVGFVKPEGNLDLKNHLAYGLRLGKNLDGYFFDQAELGIDYSRLVEVKKSGGAETDITRIYANAVKNLVKTGDFSVYGLVGIGYEDLAENFAGNDDELLGQYGIGLRYQITDVFALKSEIRHAIKFGSADNNLFASLGFGFSFGAKSVTPAPTPEKEMMPEQKEPIVILDDDKDGVKNDVDECKNTPEGVVVDEKGCEKVIRLNVYFAFDQANIKAEYMKKIKEVADFMSENPNYKVLLEGHTDSIGTEAYNEKLSLKRANAVSNKLQELGVEKSKITAVGLGELSPISDNKTKSGRALNRRVDAKFNSK